MMLRGGEELPAAGSKRAKANYRIPKRKQGDASGGSGAGAGAAADEDFSDSGDSAEDSDSEVVEEPKAPKPNGKAAAAAPAKKARTSAATVHKYLAQITPAGVSERDALAIVFDSDVMRKVARCEPVPSAEAGHPFHPDGGQLGRMCTRYDLALGRLHDHLGSAVWQMIVGDEPPADADSLAVVAELLEDTIRREDNTPTGARSSSSATPYSEAGGSGTSALSSDSTQTYTGTQQALKPAEGVAHSKRAAAVLPETAEALWSSIEQSGPTSWSSARALAATKRAADVTTLIGSAPEQLRSELQRAVLSNAEVDNQGEVRLWRRTLPTPVMKARCFIHQAMADTVAGVAKGDSTGSLSMSYEDALELAYSALEGRCKWATLEAAYAKMVVKGRSANAADKIRETWSLAEPLFRTMLSSLCMDDAGLKELSTRMNAPQSQSRVTPELQGMYAAKVLDAFNTQAYKFRKAGGDRPRFDKAVAEHDSFYMFEAHAQAIAERTSAAAAGGPRNPNGGPRVKQPGGQGGQGKDASGKGRGKGKGTPGKSTPTGGKTQGVCWKEKTATIDLAKFKVLRQAAEAKWPDACPFWVVGTCRAATGQCPKKHERPADFEAFLDANGFKLDGSEKCEHRRAPPASACAPAPASASASTQASRIEPAHESAQRPAASPQGDEQAQGEKPEAATALEEATVLEEASALAAVPRQLTVAEERGSRASPTGKTPHPPSSRPKREERQGAEAMQEVAATRTNQPETGRTHTAARQL